MNCKNSNPKAFAEYCKDNKIEVLPQKPYVSHIKPTLTPKNQVRHHIADVNEPIAYNILAEPLYHDSFYQDGQKLIVANLRRNKYKILRTLDLHNFRQNEAIAALESFIHNTLTPGNTCLKIIHGKGHNSKDGKAVLRAMVRRFLEFHPRILAYTNAQEQNGGDGVTLVKLKTQDKT